MSRFVPIVVLLMVALGNAQRGSLPSSSNPKQPRSSHADSATATVPAAQPQAKPPAGEIGPDFPVITLHGLCSAGKASDSGPCTTTLTRDQFEDVLSAVSLSGQAFTAGAMRNVAETYVQNLILADAAEKAGVDKDPRIQELLKVVRMRTLAEAYRHAMEEKYRNPSADEIEKYYQGNIAKFETARADRLLVPKFDPKSPKEGVEEFQKKAAAIAQEIRERAAKGESMDRLQNEAFMKLGITPPALVPETGLRRRASFPPDIEKDVFALKPGEVTKVESEAGGFVIYRMIDKSAYTLEQAKGEIVRDLYRQKMEVSVKGALQAVKTEFNEQYFAPPTAPQPITKPRAGSAKTPSSRSTVAPPISGKKPVPPSTPTPK